MSETMKDTVQRAIRSLELAGEQLDPAVVDGCVEMLLDAGGNILVTGMGTSGAVARRTAHLLGCAGLRAFFIHPADQQHGASGALSADDVIIVFSKGGESDEINTYLAIAKERGCTVLAITGRRESTMTGTVDAKIVVEIPDANEGYGVLPTGSTLAVSMVADVLLLELLERKGFDREGFATLHPGGMTGKKLGER